MRWIAVFLAATALGCRSNAGGAADDQDMAAPEEHPDNHAAAAAENAMAGMVAEDLHDGDPWSAGGHDTPHHH